MIPATFDYVRPATLSDAIQVLLDHDGEAVLMSGGQSLVPMLKLRLAQPSIVVDLAGITGLDAIEDSDAQLRIGARTTHRAVADHPGIRSRLPMLAELAAGIGDPQVRDWGTIGGSLAHNDPAADWPAGLIASRATIVCHGGDGERDIAVRDLGVGAYATVLELGEVITQIRVPWPSERSGSGYVKVPRAGGDFAVAGAAVVLELDRSGRVESAGIGLTAVSEIPFAVTEAEALIIGEGLDDAVLERCATVAAEQSDPSDGIHGSVDYRRAVAREVTLRALRLAGERANASLGQAEGITIVSLQHVEMRVNGQETQADIEARLLLVQLLRDVLGLTGTHVGCDTSQCGACTVLVDGRSTKSCTVLAMAVSGSDVSTIEGMAAGNELHPIQRAFRDAYGLQCGFCTPGMIMQAAWLLGREPDPSQAQIREAIGGNLCRCTGYVTIVAAIEQAARERRERGLPGADDGNAD